MIALVAFVAFLGVCLTPCDSTVYSRCELAIALRDQGFVDLPNWVCLVESESGRDTSSVGVPNTDGSQDFGLFQINNKWWCGMDGPAGDCNIACRDLTDDNINDDCICAKKIWQVQGWTAWHGWVRECQGQPLPDVSGCF